MKQTYVFLDGFFKVARLKLIPYRWGILGRHSEKILSQDATRWTLKAMTPFKDTGISSNKFVGIFGPSMVGSLTILIILFLHIGSVTSQGFMNNPIEGKILYHTHCLRCHGSLGDGKGPDATMLIVPPRDFHTAESTSKTKYELRSIIIWGLVFSPMHSWGFRLTPQEIRDVISYIRQLAPYQPRI